MKISIIVPIYNVEAYIEECLESITSMKAMDMEIECIIVNDCTPDGSMDIVRRFVEGYHGKIRFRLLDHEVNLGISATRNTGIHAATGDYILFIDSDDSFFDNCLEVVKEGFRMAPQADIIQMNNRNNNHGSQPYYDDQVFHVLRSKTERLGILTRYGVPVNPWNRLVRRDLILREQLYFEEGIVFEDYLWSYRLFDAASLVVVMPQVTYNYRSNDGSIMHNRERNIGMMIRSWDVILTQMLQMRQTIRGCLFVYVCSRLLEMKDMMSRHAYPDETVAAARRLEEKLLRNVFRSRRPLLMLFAMTMKDPFWRIYMKAAVRRNYYKIERVMLAIEFSFDRRAWKR